LIWKEAIIGIEANFGSFLHRFSQEVSSELPRQHGWNSFFEEKPDMPATEQLILGFSQTPRTHSFAQAGEYPAFPVFRLSKRSG
jgi:hypothetical protein